jgi:hypothetical protein
MDIGVRGVFCKGDAGEEGTAPCCFLGVSGNCKGFLRGEAAIINRNYVPCFDVCVSRCDVSAFGQEILFVLGDGDTTESQS